MFRQISDNIYIRVSNSFDSNIIFIDAGEKQVLIDAGTGMYPDALNQDLVKIGSSVKALTDIVLTHSHIDHSGGLPLLYKDRNVPFFTNSISLAITEVLIKDMIKISNHPYSFGYRELDYLKQNSYFLKNGIRHKIHDNFYLTFIDAGHIPGSVSILLEVDQKTILYSGDFNNQITNLINPCLFFR